MAHKSKTRGIHSDLFGYVEEVMPKVTELLKNRESVVGRQIAEKTKILLIARRGYLGGQATLPESRRHTETHSPNTRGAR